MRRRPTRWSIAIALLGVVLVLGAVWRHQRAASRAGAGRAIQSALSLSGCPRVTRSRLTDPLFATWRIGARESGSIYCFGTGPLVSWARFTDELGARRALRRAPARSAAVVCVAGHDLVGLRPGDEDVLTDFASMCRTLHGTLRLPVS